MNKLVITLGITMLVLVIGLWVYTIGVIEKETEDLESKLTTLIDTEIEKALFGTLTSDEVISRVKKHLGSKENCQWLVAVDTGDVYMSYGWSATFEPLERSWSVITNLRTPISSIDLKYHWRYYGESDSMVSVPIPSRASRPGETDCW